MATILQSNIVMANSPFFITYSKPATQYDFIKVNYGFGMVYLLIKV
jgi:hypothetical protein